MTFNYEYEFDGVCLDRWHIPSERRAEIVLCSNEFTAINRAKKDFKRLANMARGKGRQITAVWHYGGGKRVPLEQA
jgi:hypothetical protein